MHASNALFLFVLTLGAGFFALNVQRLYRYMRIGKPDARTDHPVVRVKNVLRIGIAQAKIFRDPVAGTMHAAIFWGFMVLTAGTVEILMQGVFASFSFALLLPRPAYQLYAASQDGFAAIVLAAIAFAFYRRLVLHPRRLEGDKLEHTDALIILGMIGGLMVTLLLTNACQFLLDPSAVGPEKFVSRAVAGVIRPLDPAPRALASLFWWMHALLILTFLNYLPYSKHLHVVTSLINVYFSNTAGPGQKGVMRAMDLEADVERFGAADVEDLTWKNLLDGYSCTECGRCTAACPANLTGKLLSPRKIVINARQRLMEKAPVVFDDRMEFLRPALLHGEGDAAGATTVAQVLEHRLLDTYISEEELWACT
ncbi:MAG TPA: (Fe-S)-binding protein, partial [Gemmatimonadaceae bacterium]